MLFSDYQTFNVTTFFPIPRNAIYSHFVSRIDGIRCPSTPSLLYEVLTQPLRGNFDIQIV